MEKLLEWYETNKISSNRLKNSEEYKEIISITSFLNDYYDKITIAQRIWHIKNNNFELQRCKICGNILQYKKQEKNYKQTCCNECFKQYLKSEEYSLKQKEKSNQSIEKIKQTNLEKFGVDNYSKTEEFKEKYKLTCSQRYGVDNYSKTEESKRKQKKTCLLKYNREWYQQTNDFKNTRKILLEKFLFGTDYKLISHSIKENSSYYHELKCPICEKIFKIENTTLHDRISNHQIACTNCNPTEGKFWSYGEKEVLEYVNSIYKEEILENVKNIVFPYELDIYLPKIKLAIEYNGDFWHMNPKFYEPNYICKGNGKTAKEIWEKDIKKINLCYDKDIILIDVWEDDWINDKENVKKNIINIITELLNDIS